MSRREGRDSDSRHHRSRFDREPRYASLSFFLEPRYASLSFLTKARSLILSSSFSKFPNFQTSKPPTPSSHINFSENKNRNTGKPTMADILESSKAQNLDLRLQTLGPFFRITAKSLETHKELGKAEGMIRAWWKKGKILHLDSIRLTRETLEMEKSIFGIGLFLGAVMVRYGYDCGCKTAELLAINDSDVYHAKLVKFYKRIGFEVAHEVTGSSMGDLPHMLVWGGVGTRMDADLERLLVKWCTRFSHSRSSTC